MRDHPVIHVETRLATKKEITDYIVEQLDEIRLAQDILEKQGRSIVELVAEKNALTSVLKFLERMG